MREIATIGVYGTTEDSFFQAIKDFKTTHFVDIRLRRGLRGHEYAYANSTALQQKLAKLGIEYRHELDLAPTRAILDAQHEVDKETHTATRKRETLSDAYKDHFKKERLSHVDPKALLNTFPENARIILFCVEHSPLACHRSIVADLLAKDNWKDITPA
jgi:uncharacterized protein (DUF488 family)